MTPQQIKLAKSVTFYSSDLERTVTVGEFWKELMCELNRKEESFSGKRPFGNSGWKHEAQVALIKAGLLEGSLDSDGYVKDIDEEGSYHIFDAIIRSFK